MTSVIFIHGLESSGQGFKAQFFRGVIPACLTPNFKGFSSGMSYKNLLKERMAQLTSILEKGKSWVIIGSSFGGLMGALYACQYPNKVKRLILLAPALKHLDFKKLEPIGIPVVIYHGKNDLIVPMKTSRVVAEHLFTNLTYNVVDDDYLLQSTVVSIDWQKIIYNE